MAHKTYSDLKARTTITNSGCWLWLGSKDRIGYGAVWHDSKMYKVHRLMYQLSVGQIWHGLEIDHVCFQPSCINPQHLRTVTRKENCSHRKSRFRVTCKHGHPWTEASKLINRKGHWICRICRDARVKAYNTLHPEKRMEAWQKYDACQIVRADSANQELAYNRELQ